MRDDRRLLVVVLAVLLWGGCPGSGISPTHDGGLPGDGDGASEAGVCPAAPCPTGQVCYQGTCVSDLGPCATDDDCINDSFCHEGRCVPYGPETKTHDPACKNGGFEPEAFKAPTVKCQYNGYKVMMTPVVADLDGDKKPEIVFLTRGANPNHLVAVHGDSCEVYFDKVVDTHDNGPHLAVADLDGDQQPEIVGINTGGHVVVFDHQGTLLATSPEAAQISSGALLDVASGPAIANLDNQGVPEIVHGGMAVRFENNQLVTVFNTPAAGGYIGFLSAVADVDLDGKPEVIVGNAILDGLTGADKTPAPVKSFPGGYVAIGRFDPATPEPEIVLVSSPPGSAGVLRVYRPSSGEVIFGPYTIGTNQGGPPTIADFDGDGRPEIGVAGNSGYTVFDLDCAQDPLPAGCEAEGIRWTKATKDASSGCTGSSVFDFNGDKQAEVVYRDECWLRVYDGKTGTTLFAQGVTSATHLEYPVIADVDNDGHAEIVVTSDNEINPAGYCPEEVDLQLPPLAQATTGVLVLEDPEDRWMPSRAIWNQHSYHITNVNDDGTIPLTEQNNWESWNNYRQNVQGSLDQEIPGVDLTSRWHTAPDSATNCSSRWILVADICNRGPATAPTGLSGTFYLGEPGAGGQKICTGETEGALAPGACTLVKCEYADPPTGPIDLWFVADDDGSGGGTVIECKEQNNPMHMAQIVCPGKID